MGGDGPLRDALTACIGWPGAAAVRKHRPADAAQQTEGPCRFAAAAAAPSAQQRRQKVPNSARQRANAQVGWGSLHGARSTSQPRLLDALPTARAPTERQRCKRNSRAEAAEQCSDAARATVSPFSEQTAGWKETLASSRDRLGDCPQRAFGLRSSGAAARHSAAAVLASQRQLEESPAVRANPRAEQGEDRKREVGCSAEAVACKVPTLVNTNGLRSLCLSVSLSLFLCVADEFEMDSRADMTRHAAGPDRSRNG